MNHEEQTHAEQMNGAAKKVDDAASSVKDGIRWLRIMVIVVFVFQLALQWQILQLNDKLDSSSHNTAQVSASVDVVDKNVKKLTDFADDLQTQTPAEQASQQNVQKAVSLVPIIVDILCEQYPDTPSCKER